MGSLASVAIVLQASYAMAEEHTYRNLHVHLYGLGKYFYWNTEVFKNTSLNIKKASFRGKR